MAQKICPKCFNSIDGSAKVCPYCFADLSDNPFASVNEYIDAGDNKRKKEKSNLGWLRWVYRVALVALIVAGIICR